MDAHKIQISMKTQGKNRMIMLFAGGAAALVAAALLLTYIGLSTEKYVLPEDYVDKNTKDDSSGPLLINTIVRYAVKVNVTALDLSNRNITVGVASQTDELNFGNLPQNITMRKFLVLNNSENVPVKLCIVKRGDAAGNLHVAQGDSMIIPGKGRLELELNFNATQVGPYRGEIDLVVRKPRHEELKYFVSFIGC
jgi:hypothetical protein